jgi:glucan phosphoethanolaminetransferase (alkaline phosphatase superfamily)
MDLIDKELYQSLFQEPVGWALKVFSNIPHLFISFLIAIIVFSPPLLLALFFIKAIKSSKGSYSNLIIGVMSLSLLQIAMLLGVGYFDYRYFSLFILVGYMVMYPLVLSSISIGRKNIKFFVAVSLSFVYVVSVFMNVRFISTTNYERNVVLDTLVEEVSYCSDNVGAQFHFFNDDTFAAKFGALTGKRTIMIPSNWNDLSDLEQKHFVEKYAPYLYVDINDYQNHCRMQSLPKVVTK